MGAAQKEMHGTVARYAAAKMTKRMKDRVNCPAKWDGDGKTRPSSGLSDPRLNGENRVPSMGRSGVARMTNVGSERTPLLVSALFDE
jgi:hypothetical protein